MGLPVGALAVSAATEFDFAAPVRFGCRLGRYVAQFRPDPRGALLDEYRVARRKKLVEMFRHLEAVALYEGLPDGVVGGRLSLVKLDEATDLGHFEWRFVWEFGPDPVVPDER